MKKDGMLDRNMQQGPKARSVGTWTTSFSDRNRKPIPNREKVQRSSAAHVENGDPPSVMLWGEE